VVIFGILELLSESHQDRKHRLWWFRQWIFWFPTHIESPVLAAIDRRTLVWWRQWQITVAGLMESRRSSMHMQTTVNILIWCRSSECQKRTASCSCQARTQWVRYYSGLL
jgi:hypothetical protein